MRILWLPIVGGFGAAYLHPLFCRAVGAPMTGILGHIGAVSIGLAGAVLCGSGAMAPWKAWSGWFRDPQVIGVSAIMLVLVLMLLMAQIPEWRSGRWDSRTFELPFVIGSIVVGALIRFSFDGVVWVFGLWGRRQERPRVSNSSEEKCL